MTNNYYQIYKNKVLMLVETIVIKSIDTVNGLNQLVTDTALMTGSAPVDFLNPHSWKYYLNISGQYHPTDTPMHIISLDTLEQIEFNKENLKLHLATAKGYQFGTREYRILVNQYPQQEMLIKGILNPVDIDKAIISPDGTILGYPTDLVEVNEYSLISNLQKWIDGYRIRWVNPQFSVSDSLYPATSLGIMYLNLAPVIMNLRLEACKTNEAHSYHVHQYLESHGLLDISVVNMTTAQSLFFYRNIAYIERNSGKREIFDWLVQNVMTVRGLPIAEYVMKHSTENQLQSLKPDLLFQKRPLNSLYGKDKATIFSLDQIVSKEDHIAPGNVEYRVEEIDNIHEVMENSVSNVVLTKLLESSIIDDSNSASYNLNDILLNHWIYLSSVGIYKAFVTIKNPKTGEALSLSAAEAFVLAWYAFCNSININPPTIPQIFAKKVQRVISPAALNHKGIVSNVADIDDIMSIVDSKLVPRSVAEQALSMQPEIDPVISTQAFYELCVKIFNAGQMQWGLICSQQHNVGRAMTHAMVSRIYSDNVCTFTDGEVTYTDWFAARNIDITGITQAELGALYINLINQATGLALNTSTSLKTMQSAMISIMKQLCSYSVQFITDINTSSIQKIEWTAQRAGNVGTTASQHSFISDMASGINSANGILRESFPDVMDINVKFNHLGNSEKNAISLDIGKFFDNGTLTNVFKASVNISRVGAKPIMPDIVVPKGITPMLGVDGYLSLTLTQQQGLKDIYGNKTVVQ